MPESKQRTCDVDDCERKHHAKGLCNMHTLRLRKYGTLDQQVQVRTKKFNEEVGSIASNLSKLPKTVRSRYKKNRMRYAADYQVRQQQFYQAEEEE